MLGTDPAFAAARVARKLGLTGPALAVQSACSSSLMAVHQAAIALAAGSIDAAIVVAGSLATPHPSGYIASAGDVLSPSGRCSPFDAAADGVVPGQGGAAVVLTRMTDALARGSDVLAVVAGTAAGNDGAAAGSFTHPHPEGQATVLRAAMADAGISPEQVRYVEAHGTATALGDPIEIRGLHQAHGDGPECLLGGVKANVGHLDAAAGITGLLKAALVVNHGVVPAQPGFGAPNPALGLDRTRFRIADATTSLPDGAAVTVSSFGMGGSNASAVLIAAPPRRRRDPVRRRSWCGHRRHPCSAPTAGAWPTRSEDAGTSSSLTSRAQWPSGPNPATTQSRSARRPSPSWSGSSRTRCTATRTVPRPIPGRRLPAASCAYHRPRSTRRTSTFLWPVPRTHLRLPPGPRRGRRSARRSWSRWAPTTTGTCWARISSRRAASR
ncbi:polyketide synthase [Tsukamurella sp. PLM1]|uniref:beta-ketoacyl [acyl carrier protein] synthase domain-containing protein n=1 Tax=Tsukamurella sp. PLM1 TaxID=2929795 RepID=UPI0021131932|nr:polyketide synthase [Tsukamurella sp. PLM1]